MGLVLDIIVEILILLDDSGTVVCIVHPCSLKIMLKYLRMKCHDAWNSILNGLQRKERKGEANIVKC